MAEKNLTVEHTQLGILKGHGDLVTAIVTGTTF